MTHVHDRVHHRLIYPWSLCHWSQLPWWWLMMFPPCLPLVTGHHWSVVTVWAWSQHVSAGHRSSPETLVATMSYTSGQQPRLPPTIHRHQEEQMMFSDHSCSRGSHYIGCTSQTGPRPRPLSATGALLTRRRWCFNGHKKPASTDSLESVSIIKLETNHSRVSNSLIFMRWDAALLI